MFHATITLNDPDLMTVLQAEDHGQFDRSTLELSKNTVTITATDITAFKATVNGLIKIIEAYEKASSVAQ